MLFHDCLLGQLATLQAAAHRAELADPAGAANNANVKLFRAASTLMLETIPRDPGHARFRLFFRYDSVSHIIIYAWINDSNTLRSAGSGTDPYAVFRKMLDRGHPPDNGDALLAESARPLKT